MDWLARIFGAIVAGFLEQYVVDRYSAWQIVGLLVSVLALVGLLILIWAVFVK